MEQNYIVKKWWSFLLRGIIALAFGVLALVWPTKTTIVLVILFGIFALVDGVFDVIQSIVLATKKERWGWVLVKGLVGLLIGILVLARPDIALGVLVILIAVWAIASGFIEIAAALDMPPESGRGIVGIVGALSLVIGILLLIAPFTGALAIMIVIGIYAVIAGIVLIVISFFAKKWERKLAAA